MLLPLPSNILHSTHLPIVLPFPSPLPSHQNPKTPKIIVRNSSSTSATPTTAQIAGKTAIRRIAEKLRNLGYIPEDEKSGPENGQGSAGEIFLPSTSQLPNHRPGYTIDSSWSTPENPVPQPGSGTAIARFHELRRVYRKEKQLVKELKEAPTLAELSLPSEELRRLRGVGIGLNKKLKVGKAGVTEGIVNGIHERWRRAEVVKIKCEDICRMNMKRTHDILERKTGGLVIWRSGSTIILYRGTDYKYPYFFAEVTTKNDTAYDESSSKSSMECGGDGEKRVNLVCTDGVRSGSPTIPNGRARSSLVQGVGSPNRVRFILPGEAQLAEEGDILLSGLGPRFRDWWGCDPVPVDADLLPAVVRGHRRPFRLLPYGLKPKLTDDEMTTLRRLGRPLPCHFALGRNRNLQGLAVSMIKLWEKCELAKIAVKRGVQNTNSEIMAEELKRLTGGTLISRDREFIVFYRGKDFLPPAVSTAVEERRKHGLSVMRKLRGQVPPLKTMPKLDAKTHELVTTDELLHRNEQKNMKLLSGQRIMDKESVSVDEVLHINERKNMEVHSEQRKMELRSMSMKRISTKLTMALEKKAKTDKLLEELEKAAENRETEVDKEGITEEERYMLRKVGLRMKPFLLLGRRGVFDGTVENMHLHWKYRELVKIICSERGIEDVHGAARTLEAESGGILVAVERVNRGYAIIVYRGKNYQRPVVLRPQTLLNKKQALKRSIEAQRRESLKLHVLKLTRSIDHLKHQLVKDGMEMSNVLSGQDADPVPGMSHDLEEFSCSQNNAASLKSGATDHDFDSTALESHSSMDALRHSEGTIDMDKLMNSYSKYDEPVKTELDSISNPDIKENKSTKFQDEVGGTAGSDVMYNSLNSMPQDAVTCSESVNAAGPVSDAKLIKLPHKMGRNGIELSFRRDVKHSDMEFPSTGGALSNRDRLLLRKQALKMPKRPVLAVGRNNVISGVAKTIKTHFRKYPLAIVNVKGRAKGTSVQEVVYELEKATGGVLVSQEPSKVILYRGWGREEDKRNGKEGIAAPEVVSPQLLEAIRLECGLQSKREEEIL